MPFRAVNRRDQPGYDQHLQRHHLLPRQIMRTTSLRAMLETLGNRRIGFDDFRRNGMLLPSRESASVRMGMPLHRGPHRQYNEMVIERVGAIDREWRRRKANDQDQACIDAILSLRRLQMQLRLQLLDRHTPVALHRRCPVGTGIDFSTLDAMADLLWEQTGSLAKAA